MVEWITGTIQNTEMNSIRKKQKSQKKPKLKLSLNEYFSGIFQNSVESLTNKIDYIKDRVSCLKAKGKN